MQIWRNEIAVCFTAVLFFRICTFLLIFFDDNVLDTVAQDEIDEFVAGIVAFGGDFVKFFEGIFADADGDYFVAVFSTFFDS